MTYAVVAYVVTALVLLVYAARVVMRERALARTEEEERA